MLKEEVGFESEVEDIDRIESVGPLEVSKDPELLEVTEGPKLLELETMFELDVP